MNRKYIASGFRQDMETLFNRFIHSTEDNGINGSESVANVSGNERKSEISVRFSRFCGLWREMGFSFIFSFRLNDNHLREFVDEIYLEVLPNVCEEHRFERRVCALYLLYSLFVKYPKTGAKTVGQRIRINFSYLEQIRELIQKCKRLEQWDVCYVWYKLLSLGAIDFVHVSRLMGPQYIRNSRVTDETQTQTDFLIDQFKASLYPRIHELSEYHEKYRQIKEELIKDDSRIQDINLIEDNIFELSKAKIDNLHKEFSNQSKTATLESMNNEFDNDLEEEINEMNGNNVYNIGDKRRKIKEKALGFGTKTSQKNVVTSVEQNVSQTQTKSDAKPKSRRGRPKKCKLTDIH